MEDTNKLKVMDEMKLIEAVIQKLKKNLYAKLYSTHEIEPGDPEAKDIVDTVISTLFEGVEIDVAPSCCIVQVGSFTIKALDSQGEVAGPDCKDFLTTDNYIVESDIDNNSIIAVELPVFDCSCTQLPLTVKLTILPVLPLMFNYKKSINEEEL